MNLSIREEDRKRKTEHRAMICIGALALFQSAIGTPVYHLLNSNVVFQATVLPQIWDVITYFAAFAFYWCAFAFLLYLSARHSLKASMKTIVYYLVFSAARYVLSLAIGSIMLLQFPVWSDLWDFLIEMTGDGLQIAVAALLIYLIFEKGKTDRVQIDLKRLFSTSNLFLRGMLAVSLIPTVVRLLTRIYYDIYIGLPQSGAELLGMIFWYALDLLCALIGYLLIYWIVSKLLVLDLLAEREQEKNDPSS